MSGTRHDKRCRTIVAAGAWVPLVLQVIPSARDDFAANQPDCVQDREAGDQEQGRDDRFAFREELEAGQVKDHIQGERKGDPPAIELLSFGGEPHSSKNNNAFDQN